MNQFWNSVLRPIVEAGQPKCLVEIGVDTGLLTEKLVTYAAEAGAVVHAIDPHPRIDVASWRRLYGQTLVFHQALSLEVLADLPDADAVFIDGDHNWYTVYHELQLLEETARNDGAVPPLLAMHDVDWPYGRRDMYYDSGTVPEEHRQPFRKAGMSLSESGLVDVGMNSQLYNAVSAVSARNGVRTALEDFISDSDGEWLQTFIPGFHGLAVIVPVERLNGNEALRAALRALRNPEFWDDWARGLETARVKSLVDAERQQYRHSDELGRLVSRTDELERQLRDAIWETEVAHDETRELGDRLAVDARLLNDVFNSPSWRLTKPLRDAKRVIKGFREPR